MNNSVITLFNNPNKDKSDTLIDYNNLAIMLFFDNITKYENIIPPGGIPIKYIDIFDKILKQYFKNIDNSNLDDYQFISDLYEVQEDKSEIEYSKSLLRVELSTTSTQFISNIASNPTYKDILEKLNKYPKYIQKINNLYNKLFGIESKKYTIILNCFKNHAITLFLQKIYDNYYYLYRINTNQNPSILISFLHTEEDIMYSILKIFEYNIDNIYNNNIIQYNEFDVIFKMDHIEYMINGINNYSKEIQKNKEIDIQDRILILQDILYKIKLLNSIQQLSNIKQTKNTCYFYSILVAVLLYLLFI